MNALTAGSGLARTWAFTRCEWRAQRGFLLAVTALMVLCGLATHFGYASVQPGVDAGATFATTVSMVATCLICCALLLAQRTISAEFETPHGDQWIRRVGGGLACSWCGKGVALATAIGAMVAVGAATLWLVRPPAQALEDGAFRLVRIGTGTLWGLVVVPWFWAWAMWMPKGRMAFAIAVLVAVGGWLGHTVAIPWAAPGLERTLAWTPWLIAAGCAGPIVAARSWLARRGAGWKRSFRVGAILTSLALMPMVGWLGSELWAYHRWTDVNRVANLHGVDAEGRFALVELERPSEWLGQDMLRLDMETGAIARLPRAYYTPFSSGPLTWLQRPVRFWIVFDADSAGRRLLDLRTGDLRELPDGPLPKGGLRLPEDLRDVQERSELAASPFRQRNGLAVWPTTDAVLFEEADGSIRREPPVREQVQYAGEGWSLPDGKAYDFATAQIIDLPRAFKGAICLDGDWYYEQRFDRPDLRLGWESHAMVRHPDGTTEPLPESIALIHGACGRRLVILDRVHKHATYDPATGDIEPLQVRSEFHGWQNPGWNRDPQYAAYRAPETLETTVISHIAPAQLFALPDGTAVVFDETSRKILRLHPDGRREAIYPR